MNYLISYDIPSNKHRKKVADLLLRFGLYRVQYSVFLGQVKKVYFKQLKGKLDYLIHETGASGGIIILKIDLDHLEKIVTLGKEIPNLKKISGKQEVIIL